MNKLIYKIIPVLLVLFMSCEQDNETEGVSRVTFYNDIEFIGDENMIVDQGGSFVDPGAIAFEGETDVTDQITVSGTVDTNTIGYYQVEYNIVNVDGFGKSIVRNVFVAPADRSTSDIYAGTYTGVVSTGTHTDVTTITHLGDGLYYCTDFIGGRYNIGFGYGPVYKLSGYFYVNGDGQSFGALIVNSVWGPWDVFDPTLTGTTFHHLISSGGGTKRDVTLIKQ
ncbi:immunoglobulin-like domain-containing protein [Lutibacter citreus]|uniref:immunoglobulin-like domain-containing protein n=1 Tax=Lutibacter citreus TaxID=2138210 RepID=UPI000DBE2274|nr:immunoglobulin-like domain-containing protein [Lutibacter citreus]